MANTFPLVQATAQFAIALRARSLGTRVVSRSLDPAPANVGDTLNIRFSLAKAALAVTPGPTPTAAQDTAPTTVPLVINKMYERSMAITDRKSTRLNSSHG